MAQGMARKKAEKDELEERIQELGARIRTAKAQADELPALAERADTYLKLAALLRGIPAAQSERWALNGLDPTHLAMLALKDAKRGVAAAPKDGGFHRRLGEAHADLEQYAQAREGFLEALSLDSTDAAAAAGVTAASAALADGPQPPSPTSPAVPPKRARTAVSGDVDDWECALCLKLLWEPVATPCAHLFCRPCFARNCDHNNKCPVCRTVLHVGRAIPVLTQLRSFLLKTFPEEYAARASEETVSPATDGVAPLPLFVMAGMLPGERMRLHIFEPRYRLLVRRAMEGARRLGMVAPAPDRSVAAVATECEITDCQPLPDGRFYLEVVALKRFRVARQWEQDGYRVAEPQPLADDPPPSEGEAAEQLAALISDVEAKADAWVSRIEGMGGGRLSSRVQELLERAGPKPAATLPNRPEELGFWAACLLPLGSDEQQELLGMTDSAQRLAYVQNEFERLQNIGMGDTCNMM